MIPTGVMTYMTYDNQPGGGRTPGRRTCGPLAAWQYTIARMEIRGTGTEPGSFRDAFTPTG